MTVQDALRLTVVTARVAADRTREPQPGDLVVEVSSWWRHADPDAIGWLIGQGPAPWGEGEPTDGSVPMRHVWDVMPLNPDAKLQTIGGERCQRWANAEFAVVPEELVERAELAR